MNQWMDAKMSSTPQQYLPLVGYHVAAAGWISVFNGIAGTTKATI